MTAPRRAPALWLASLAGFYAVWLWLVFGPAGGWVGVRSHWPIAVAMAIGSYFAGSTPMGGGTVGFPILVLLLGLPAALGREFSFATQSVGMVSASVLILARGQALAWPVLRGAIVGATLGLPVGMLVLAPRIPDLWAKVVFSIAWASFGVVHLYRTADFATQTSQTVGDPGTAFRRAVMVSALASATIVALTGVGVDLFIYALLVLLHRADLRIAVPTAVVSMAYTSLLGLMITLSTTGLTPDVYENWLAAAPIVILGAPIGAVMVGIVDRRFTLRLVAALCLLQFAWAMYRERALLGTAGLLVSLVAVGACVMLFERLRAVGRAARGS